MSDGSQPGHASDLAEVRSEGQRGSSRRARSSASEPASTDLVLTPDRVRGRHHQVGTAAKLGPDQLFFWLLAILTFYLPRGRGDRSQPPDAARGWSPTSGPSSGSTSSCGSWWHGTCGCSRSWSCPPDRAHRGHEPLLRAVGPGAHWMARTSSSSPRFSCRHGRHLVAVSTRGLGVGKWVHNAGGALLRLHLSHPDPSSRSVSRWTGKIAVFHPIVFAFPRSLLSNPELLTQEPQHLQQSRRLGALTGFECVAILAAGVQDPRRATSAAR